MATEGLLQHLVEWRANFNGKVRQAQVVAIECIYNEKGNNVDDMVHQKYTCTYLLETTHIISFG